MRISLPGFISTPSRKHFFYFLLLFLLFYYGNLAYMAVIDHRGFVYSPFLDNHLNYINWLRDSILYTSAFVNRCFGLSAQVSMPYRMVTNNGTWVETVYACLGLNLFSFWAAFVLSDPGSHYRKIWWTLGGIVAIWVINVFRMAMLLMALEYNWRSIALVDHHTQFNILAYVVIGLMFLAFIKGSRANTTEAKI